MAKKNTKKQIEQYEHSNEERANIPHVGLVTPTSDPETGEKKEYQYDPHLDPQLQWAGKAEHTSFEVPTVSLHVHERIDPKTIIESVKKDTDDDGQFSLFSEKKPLREAIDFYKHKEGWSNRLIAGDSLLVMNSLLEKEGMASKVQTIYIDPPYGINYGSNFQPFVSNKVVKDNDDNLTAEPEMIKAFRDTWSLGIHSYLNHLRDRILLSHQLLKEEGSIFIQISDENAHLIRNILDETFGPENFVCNIRYRTRTIPLSTKYLDVSYDHLLWYAKKKDVMKFHKLFFEQSVEGDQNFRYVELEDGSRRVLTKEEHNNHKILPKKHRIFAAIRLRPTQYRKNQDFNIDYKGSTYAPPGGRVERTPDGVNSWSTTKEGMINLIESNRIYEVNGELKYVLYHDDYPVTPHGSIWNDTGAEKAKSYVVQTSLEIPKRCILMTTDPGDLVLDPTCGSGTTAVAAELFGRRWITCDSSRVSVALARNRFLTQLYPYFELAFPEEGICSGLKYSMVNHITMGAIANKAPVETETLFDSPKQDNSKHRVTGPFTIEAVPAPQVSSFDELDKQDTGSDMSIARSGETNRQAEWRDELLRAGVRAKGGKIIEFSRVEPLVGTKFIQAEAETKEDNPKRVLVVFGPEHAPLEQRTVENAWQEARTLKPDMLLFCAFQFDEEAAKDIDELTPEIAGMQLLKAQMNADMLTDDLRKKRSSNESFWLIGQPDIKVHKVDGGKIQVEVLGFDYYNPKTGDVESGGKKNIAMWMLDTDYDDRSLFPSQVFFPMAGAKDGWSKLAKNLKAEIDEEKIEAFRGTESLPFEPGQKVAVKIIDDRGIESLRVITM